MGCAYRKCKRLCGSIMNYYEQKQQEYKEIRNAKLTVWAIIFIIALSISTFILLVSDKANAQILESINYTAETIELEKNYDNILDYEETIRCISYEDKEKTKCSVTEPIIQYLYKTETFAPENVISKNTIKIDEKTFQIYGSDTFYQEQGKDYWVYTDIGQSDIQSFQMIQEEKLTDPISKLNPFHIYKVNAQTYSGAGDGRVYSGDANWDTVHHATTGTADYTSASIGIGSNTGYNIRRAFLPFDTSALPDAGYQVTAATLYFYVNTKQGTVENDWIIIPQTTESNTTLTANDFDNITYTNLGSLNTANFVTNNYNSIALNSTGLENVNQSGYTKLAITNNYDFNDSAPPANTAFFNLYFSEQTGTANDPYLTVTTEQTETCGDNECNGEETCEDCPEDCGECEQETGTTTISDLPELPFVDDLTVITGRSEHYETSTTTPDWIEYHYYRIPFILWFIICSILLYATHFIGKVLITRWHKKK